MSGHCHDECANLPATPQCIYRLGAHDIDDLCRDIDDAKAHAATWKALAKDLRTRVGYVADISARQVAAAHRCMETTWEAKDKKIATLTAERAEQLDARLKLRAERDAATESALRRGEQITELLARVETARTWRAKQGHMLDVEIDDIGRRACTNEANALAFDERSARATNTYAHDVNADRAGQSRQRAAFLRNLAAFLAGDDGAKGEP